MAQLAVFDLDGTITRRDTLVPYLCGFLRRRPWRWPRLLLAAPAVVGFALGGRDRGRLKGALISAALGGLPRDLIAAWTAQFVAALLEHAVLPAARNAIESHRRAGDVLVLMSASPDLYVPAIGAALGFAEVICTGVLWRGDRLDGALATPNRRAAQKTRCLEALRQRHPGIAVIAYANSASDLDHMQHAERALLVNGSAKARAQAVRAGIPMAAWR